MPSFQTLPESLNDQLAGVWTLLALVAATVIGFMVWYFATCGGKDLRCVNGLVTAPAPSSLPSLLPAAAKKSTALPPTATSSSSAPTTATSSASSSASASCGAMDCDDDGGVGGVAIMLG